MSSLAKRLIFKKFRVGKLITKTHISLIHEGVNEVTNEQVAMKFERIGDKYNFLQSEAFILLLLKGIGIPRVVSYGKIMNYKVLIEELLGKSIYKIWDELTHTKETINDICLIALQCLDRLEYIHSKNVIHKDIKPTNFICGKNDPNLIYLIDFGMSRKYKSSKTGKHIKYQKLKQITGTMRYMSINTCKGYEHSRRDDLESLGYVLIFLMKKNLPWIYIENENIDNKSKFIKVYTLKETISPKKLCHGLPNEFSEYINYCQKLDFEQEPNYEYLRNLFINILNRNNKLFGMNPLDYLDFSWLNRKEAKTVQDLAILSCFHSSKFNDLKKRKNSPHKRLFLQIKYSLEKKRNQEIAKSVSSERLNSNSKIRIINNLSNKFYDDKANGKNKDNNINISNNSKIKSNIKKVVLNQAKNNIKNNESKIAKLKNVNIKKIQIEKIMKTKINTKKNIKIGDANTKKTLDKKLYQNFINTPKFTNMTNPLKNLKTHLRVNANYNPIIKHNQNIAYLQQYPNFTYNSNTNNTLKRPELPNNQKYIKKIGYNSNTNNNINSDRNKYYTSLIKRGVKIETQKNNYLSNLPFDNKFKIEYNFLNTNNFYINNNNNNLSKGRNYISSFDKSNSNLFNQNNEYLYYKYDTFQSNNYW